jgi:hypothetical protein
MNGISGKGRHGSASGRELDDRAGIPLNTERAATSRTARTIRATVLLALLPVLSGCADGGPPTVSITVVNDLGSDVTISACGSDPVFIHENAASMVALVAEDPHVTCVVYKGDSVDYLGCLSVPTTTFGNASRIRVSEMDRGISLKKCWSLYRSVAS